MSNLCLPLLLVNHVADLRKSCGLTQTQLANKVGCSKNTISLIELGKQYPTLDLAFCISSCLGVPIQSVFEPSSELVSWSDLMEVVR